MEERYLGVRGWLGRVQVNSEQVSLESLAEAGERLWSPDSWREVIVCYGVNVCWVLCTVEKCCNVRASSFRLRSTKKTFWRREKTGKGSRASSWRWRKSTGRPTASSTLWSPRYHMHHNFKIKAWSTCWVSVKLYTFNVYYFLLKVYKCMFLLRYT